MLGFSREKSACALKTCENEDKGLMDGVCACCISLNIRYSLGSTINIIIIFFLIKNRVYIIAYLAFSKKLKNTLSCHIALFFTTLKMEANYCLLLGCPGAKNPYIVR